MTPIVMKNRYALKHPLVKLLADVQFTLALIREELRCRKLFHGLREAGLEDCYFQPHLNSLIMHSMGIDDLPDATYTQYESILEKRSRKIEEDGESIMKQALKVYAELVALRGVNK
jgi:hypothetical protein